MARKRAATVLVMWKQKERYDPKHLFIGLRAELVGADPRPSDTRRSDGTISLVPRFEGEHPTGDWFPERVQPAGLLCCWPRARSGGPTIRLCCPLAEPNEEMASEALMEVWFICQAKNRYRFMTSGARQPAISRTEKP